MGKGQPVQGVKVAEEDGLGQNDRQGKCAGFGDVSIREARQKEVETETGDDGDLREHFSIYLWLERKENF